MRKLAVLFCTCLITFSVSPAQEVIENPAKPENPEARRILKVEEELRITDEGKEFFFRYPGNVKVAPDESIFLMDKDALLKFDERGKFIRNFFKKGQGPGELNVVRNYFFNGGNLVVINHNPLKIVTFDFDGELVDDVTIRETFLFMSNHFYSSGRLYFFKNDEPDARDKPGVLDVPHVLISMDRKGQDVKEHLTLPYQFYVTGGAIAGQGRLTCVPFLDRYLAIAHTEEYLVKLYDLDSQQIVRGFNRKYKRVKPPKDYRWGGIYDRNGKRMGPPPPEFLNDISAMYMVNDFLWVRTSTKDEEKGYLIDVFDLEGKFVDSFYLETDGRIVGTDGNSIFIREVDEDELFSIAKYKILG